MAGIIVLCRGFHCWPFSGERGWGRRDVTGLLAEWRQVTVGESCVLHEYLMISPPSRYSVSPYRETFQFVFKSISCRGKQGFRGGFPVIVFRQSLLYVIHTKYQVLRIFFRFSTFSNSSPRLTGVFFCLFFCFFSRRDIHFSVLYCCFVWC